MKIISETSLDRFEAWSGGKDTLDVLVEKDLCDQLEAMLENDIFPDGCTDTELNDLLWFERDAIAEWLGFSSWDALEYGEEDEAAEDEDEDEEESAFSAFCDSFADCMDCPYFNRATKGNCEELFKADHKK